MSRAPPSSLPPGLGLPPRLRPRRDLVPIPHPAAIILCDGSGEASLACELVCSLLANAEELGDVDEAQLTLWGCHKSPGIGSTKSRRWPWPPPCRPPRRRTRTRSAGPCPDGRCVREHRARPRFAFSAPTRHLRKDVCEGLAIGDLMDGGVSLPI